MAVSSSTYVSQLYRGDNIKKMVGYVNFDRVPTFPFTFKTTYSNRRECIINIIKKSGNGFINFDRVPTFPFNIKTNKAKVISTGVVFPKSYSRINYEIKYSQTMLANSTYPFPMHTLFSLMDGWTNPYSLAGVQFYSFWN